MKGEIFLQQEISFINHIPMVFEYYFPNPASIWKTTDDLYMAAVQNHFSKEIVKRWRASLDFANLTIKMAGHNWEGAMYTLQASFGNDKQVSSLIKNKVHEGLKEASRMCNTSMAQLPVMQTQPPAFGFDVPRPMRPLRDLQ